MRTIENIELKYNYEECGGPVESGILWRHLMFDRSLLSKKTHSFFIQCIINNDSFFIRYIWTTMQAIKEYQDISQPIKRAHLHSFCSKLFYQ